ncbi:major intrinsically disordered Notch2-binding receptor 1 [Kryptolebias marmoratus]|uniref:Membrane integral NOTCH2 associated receptor 1 n=1 Tax=Kryptolebias marmoratus TaxID=37003 RepID=A0A3Q2ZV55_KRYMA|nr:major intrinsically disordered Notch2-binding receptor 1 [Kryptolebias marmoratus]XP_037835963.1 major intrinsically disordered Notch2-binding receptor 1 [Kryptolebias marmoratus]
MEPLLECSLILGQILEELDNRHSTMTYQDLCMFLCSRFDLVHLAKVRSLLFYTACLDPGFPASLFKDKMHHSPEDLQSKKLMIAADIVTMFNLIQMNGERAKDQLSTVLRAQIFKHQSMELSRSDNESSNHQDNDRRTSYKHMDYPTDGHHNHPLQQHLDVQGASSCPKLLEKKNCQLVSMSDPNFFLRFNRAPVVDKAHHLPQVHSSLTSGPTETQSTYYPMESTTDQESLQHSPHPEGFSVRSCSQKRNIFKEDFHNFVAFSPKVTNNKYTQRSKAADSFHRRDEHKPATFFNHSFEIPYRNPYFEPELKSPLHPKLRVKHESLDDLQASTYFGPTTVTEHVNSRKHINRAGMQPVWSFKSLNIEEGPPDSERSYLNSKPLQENISIISTNNEQHYTSLKEKVVNSPGFAKKGNGIKNDVALVVREATGLDKRGAVKKFRDKNVHSASFQGDISSSVGTQTEQAERKKVRDYPSKYNNRERHTLKHSEEDSEIISDDISDIFRFLDDMSVCDSMGVVQSSCHNSNGSLSQVTLKSEGDSSPEHNTVRLAKCKLDHLFQSLENPDDELKLSVWKLVMRIGEIEKKLESLSGVHSEMSQVFSKLNKLDEKIQEPETKKGQTGKTSATPDQPHPSPHLHSSTTLPPYVFQCHTTGHNVKKKYGHAGEWGQLDESDSLRTKALKRSMFTRRSSRSLNEENSATESKVASITNSLCNWGTESHSCHPGDTIKDSNKDKIWKTKEAERNDQYQTSQTQRPTKPTKELYLTEQVFVPHTFTPSTKAHTKGSLLYTNMELSNLPDGKQNQPSWTLTEYRHNPGERRKPLSVLDLQIQDCLNPNSLEYWMEDVYTPGYDTLLKRKDAEFRRAKVCKIGALIVAATCTVILVIVVPICTMNS